MGLTITSSPFHLTSLVWDSQVPSSQLHLSLLLLLFNSFLLYTITLIRFFIFNWFLCCYVLPGRTSRGRPCPHSRIRARPSPIPFPQPLLFLPSYSRCPYFIFTVKQAQKWIYPGFTAAIICSETPTAYSAWLPSLLLAAFTVGLSLLPSFSHCSYFVFTSFSLWSRPGSGWIRWLSSVSIHEWTLKTLLRTYVTSFQTLTNTSTDPVYNAILVITWPCH
jgi:hypothetical protein